MKEWKRTKSAGPWSPSPGMPQTWPQRIAHQPNRQSTNLVREECGRGVKEWKRTKSAGPWSPSPGMPQTWPQRIAHQPNRQSTNLVAQGV